MRWLQSRSGITGFFIYSVLLMLAACLLPPVAMQPGSKHFILVIGILGIWRYSWGIIHYARYWIYQKIYFPRLRRQLENSDENLMPPHMYFLVTSFRIDTETTIAVYRAAIEEAVVCGIKSTLVASIVEKSDETIVRTLFESIAPPDHVRLKIVRIPGSGKRDGLAQGFRAISRDMPNPDAIVAVIDGDSIIEEGLVRRCAPFFSLRPDLGALTTDEVCEVQGSPLIRAWHELRFAQRQILMCSLALSHKVLTLTGRMSMFRASILTHPDFISQVENDSIYHWRLGRFKFLTGDDKSSWFWLLKNGWNMLYVPDVVVSTVEHPPSGNFVKATTQLMFRWFGNMLRTNGRAIKVGPLRAGFFPWWCIVDQRISMWTALSGPVFAVFMAIDHSFVFVPIYIVWVGFTRWLMSLMVFSVRGKVHWAYPLLIYYNQIWGSLIKTYVFFRLDRQSWTRQKTKLDRGLNSRQKYVQSLTSSFSYGVAMIVFICAVGLLSGALVFPRI